MRSCVAGRLCGLWGRLGCFGGITSHVLLTIKHDEGVATMGFALLVSFLIGMSVPDDANLFRRARSARVLMFSSSDGKTYALNGAKPPKLSLQVLLISLVIQARNYQCLESIASDVGVLIWIVAFWAFGD
jgi:hypothetical protein